MFKLIKQVVIALLSFSGLLASLINLSNNAKCTYLNNQPCMTRSSLIYLNRDEYNQRYIYC